VQRLGGRHDFENEGEPIPREHTERRPTLPKVFQGPPIRQGVQTTPVQWSIRGGAISPSESDVDSRSNFDHFTERSTVNIQSISKVASAILSPLVTGAIKELPQFSGRREDFEIWKKKWDKAIRMLEASNGGPLPNTYLLELMATKLDEASQMEIAVRLRTTPQLPYLEYFAELEKSFSLKGSIFNRNQWRKITLPRTEEALTLTKWRKFKAYLEESLSECEPPSEADLREHIVAQLPSKIQTKILKQEMEVRKRQFSVRVTIPPLFDRAAVLEKFEDELQIVNLNPQIKGRVLTFNCKSEALRHIALGLNGQTIENIPGKLTVETLSSEFLPAKKILLLVDEFLTDEDEIRLAGPTNTVITKTWGQKGGVPRCLYLPLQDRRGWCH